MRGKSICIVKKTTAYLLTLVIVTLTAFFAIGPEAVEAETVGGLFIDKVTDLSAQVTGSCAPHSMIYVMTTGDTEIASGFAERDGRFAVSIPIQKSGRRMVVYASTKITDDGQEDFVPYAVKEIEVEDVTPPPAPVATQFANYGLGVKGSAEKQSVVFVYIDGYMVVSKKVNSAGKFSIDLPFLYEGMFVEVVAVDQGGRFSVPTTFFAD